MCENHKKLKVDKYVKEVVEITLKLCTDYYPAKKIEKHLMAEEIIKIPWKTS